MHRAWKPGLGLLVVGTAGCLATTFKPPPAGIVKQLLPPAPNEPGPTPERLPEAPRSRFAPAAPSTSPASRATPLQLGDVLLSVDQGFPLLLAILEERSIASGQRLAAEGAFDTNLVSRQNFTDGTYNNNRFDLMLEQASSLYGVNFFGGYRKANGDFPVYYGDRKTGENGELRGGFLIPFLRNGPIDKNRAALRQAQISETLADPVIQAARLSFLRAGAQAYWLWVASGERFRIEDDLLKIARERQTSIETLVKAGQRPEIESIDNRRSIVEREGRLIAAERSVQQAAITLSLYYRDSSGNPLVPAESQLPRTFIQMKPEQPKSELLKQDIETAYNNRPELMRFQLLKERVSVDLQLAENTNLPTLSGGMSAFQDFGKGKETAGSPFDSQAFEANMLFSMPLQFRQARGDQQRFRGALMQLQMQEQFQRENIGAEVQDAVSNLDRSYARFVKAQEEAEIAQRVVQLEKTRFENGGGTILEVNLRELAAADAQRRVVDALTDYYRASADYRAALGLDNAQQR